MGKYHMKPRRIDEPIDDDATRARARAIVDRAAAEQERRRAAHSQVLDFSGVRKPAGQ